MDCMVVVCNKMDQKKSIYHHCINKIRKQGVDSCNQNQNLKKTYLTGRPKRKEKNVSNNIGTQEKTRMVDRPNGKHID